MTLSMVKRIEPYQRSRSYEEHKPLLAFIRRVAVLLAPEFSPPDVAFSQKNRPESVTASFEKIVRLGNSERGFEIVYAITTHPHWGYPAVDELVVSAYGLPETQALSIRALAACSEAGYASFVELRAEGPDEVVAAIVEAFEVEFGSTKQ